MDRINQRQSVLQNGAIAGENAEQLKEQLDKITDKGQNTETNEELDKAGDAANNIRDILEGLNQ